MITIWKFPFAMEDEVEVQMPSRAEILTVSMQGSTPCVWARVHADAELRPRLLAVRGTGHSCDGLYRSNYVGTLFWASLVFHVFDRGEPR